MNESRRYGAVKSEPKCQFERQRGRHRVERQKDDVAWKRDGSRVPGLHGGRDCANAILCQPCSRARTLAGSSDPAFLVIERHDSPACSPPRSEQAPLCVGRDVSTGIGGPKREEYSFPSGKMMEASLSRMPA